MREHQNEARPRTTSHCVALREQHDDEARVASHPDSFAHCDTRVTSAGSARGHGSAVDLATGSQRARTVTSVMHLQRQYGNRYVQRVLARARQGGGEVDGDVESAIERARGGGEGLDHGVRRQMESAFGSDFQGVRVHTGAQAHELNRAVNAVAFTTGQDIFFRDGAYDPSNSEGQELLAHELTHVVQQGHAAPVAGKAQRFQIQRLCSKCESDEKKHVQGKLTVGQPDDQYELEADQVAKAITQTSPRSLTSSSKGIAAGQLSPDFVATRASSSRNTLQRQITRDVSNGHITLDATAELFEGGQMSESVPLQQEQEITFKKTLSQAANAGFHGKVRLRIYANWAFGGRAVVGPATSGFATLLVDAPFRIPVTAGTDDTVVKVVNQPHVVWHDINGTGAAMDPQPALNADVDDTGLSVTASPRVTYQEQKAEAVQGGVTVGPLSGQVQHQTQVPNTQAFEASFTAKVNVAGNPSPREYHCTQSFQPFVVGSDRFVHEDQARKDIYGWYFGLDRNVRQDLERGTGQLRITGRASRTGSEQTNSNLAELRAKRVQQIIADFAGSDAHVRSYAMGAFGAQTATEDPNERRVDVEISGNIPAATQDDVCAPRTVSATQPESHGNTSSTTPTSQGTVSPRTSPEEHRTNP